MEIRFARNLKEFREIRQIQSKLLAEKLDIQPTTVSAWENGRNYPDLVKFARLCDILSVSADELLFGKDKDLLDGLSDMQKFLIVQTAKEFKKSAERHSGD